VSSERRERRERFEGSQDTLVPARNDVDIPTPNDRLLRLELPQLRLKRLVPGDFTVHVLELLGGVGRIGSDQVQALKLEPVAEMSR
jgi:hypothetical protein